MLRVLEAQAYLSTIRVESLMSNQLSALISGSGDIMSFHASRSINVFTASAACLS